MEKRTWPAPYWMERQVYVRYWKKMDPRAIFQRKLSYSIKCLHNYDFVLYTHEINIPNNINQFNPTKTQF